MQGVSGVGGEGARGRGLSVFNTASLPPVPLVECRACLYLKCSLLILAKGEGGFEVC